MQMVNKKELFILKKKNYPNSIRMGYPFEPNNNTPKMWSNSPNNIHMGYPYDPKSDIPKMWPFLLRRGPLLIQALRQLQQKQFSASSPVTNSRVTTKYPCMIKNCAIKMLITKSKRVTVHVKYTQFCQPPSVLAKKFWFVWRKPISILQSLTS